jgi:hypothetical protein
MKIDPKSLSKAVDISFAKFSHFRKARLLMMSQMVGRFYKSGKVHAAGSIDEGKSAPINLLYQAASTLVPNLVYNDPKVKINTPLIAYRDYAELLGLAVDHTVPEDQAAGHPCGRSSWTRSFWPGSPRRGWRWATKC